jgi:hypothetical protein
LFSFDGDNALLIGEPKAIQLAALQALERNASTF